MHVFVLKKLDFISSFIQGVVERDEEVRKAREQVLKVQRDCEEQVAAEVTSSQEMHEKLERARERKEELKQQVAQLEDKLLETERAHRFNHSISTTSCQDDSCRLSQSDNLCTCMCFLLAS